MNRNARQDKYDWNFIEPVSKDDFQYEDNLRQPLSLQSVPREVKANDNDKFNIIHIASDALDADSGSNVNVVKINEEIVAIVPFVNTTPPPRNTPSKKAMWQEQKMNRYRYLIAGGLFISIALHGLIKYGSGYNIGNLIIQPANAQSTLQKTPPTTISNGGLAMPDWSKINFDNMKFSEGGSVEFPNIKNPGMKENRVWSAGQSLADVMELGDFEETEFKIQDFNLNQISKITGDNLKNFKLSDFELLNWQTLPDLGAVVPGLSKLKVGSVPPIAEFLKKALPSGKYSSNSTIVQVIKNNPKLKNVELGKYVKLDKYKLTSIPGIEKAQIKKFTNWQNNTIAKVPGLAKVPFNQFPGVPVPDMSFVGKVDIVLKQVENGRWKSISGSYQEGFNVPCYNQKCAHIEVAGSENLTGAAWMSGKYQKVKGGFGILGSLNGGKEPTGRHPFGKSFKQVLWEPNEAKGSITSNMFFRICKRGFIDLGCSPYFIGPVPFFEYKEMNPIILGVPLTVPKQPLP